MPEAIAQSASFEARRGARATLDEDRKDARINKNAHFAASRRKDRRHTVLGLGATVISVIVASAAGAMTQSSVAQWTWVMQVLLFLGAALSAIQWQVGYQRSADQHRAVANRYNVVQRKCKALLQEMSDTEIDESTLWNQIHAIRAEYESANVEAERCPLDQSDFEAALTTPEVTPFEEAATGGGRPAGG